MFIPEDKLLQMAQAGWTPPLQRAFLNAYGSLLRRALLSELGRRFGSTVLRGLRNALQALEQGASGGAQGVSGQLLELAQDTWQSVCLEIFKPEGNTIVQYQQHQQKAVQAGQKPLPFEGFLWGLVRLKLRQQLPRHKAIFEPVYALHEDDEDDSKLERLPDEQEVPLEASACAQMVDIYWEGLLRGGDVDPDKAARALSLGQRKDHLLCWACCRLMRALNESQRENLRAFVAFFVSNSGPQRHGVPLSERKDLSLEALSGTYLRWEEDICKVFGKSIRKDRIMAMIQKELLESPYRNQVGSGA